MNVLQTCSRCVMDTTDPDISFNLDGVCNHCRSYDLMMKNFKVKYASENFSNWLSSLKETNKNKEYDCIIGVSGGVDSSYLLYKAVKEWKLRVLAVHVDAGWNSEVAVKNIERLVSFLEIKLHTVVINWSEMKDLHLSFLKAGVPNQDIPQDHAFAAGLFKFAVKSGIKDLLSGHNEATESVLPRGWGYNPLDGTHLSDIHKRFGKKPLKAFPLIKWYHTLILFPRLHKFRIHYPLNYLNYSKDLAKKELSESLGWKDYGGKHFESRFTKFFQSYYLPKRYGFDKRKAHYSSLILSGGMSREEALSELEKPLYDESSVSQDIEYISKKLGISTKEFESYLTSEPHQHTEYHTHLETLKFLKKAKKILSFS